MEIPYGFVENNTLYRHAFGDVPALKLMEVDEDYLSVTIEKMVSNFEKLKAKLEKTIDKIDASQNKGSFLSALINIKESVTTHSGLGDYQPLLDRIALYESLLQDFVSKNRQKNTEIKHALLLELEVILSNNDMVEAFEQIKDLKIRWIKTGGADEDLSDELESKFSEGMDGFFEKRKSFMEAKNLLKAAREEDYQTIIDQIKFFIQKKNFKTSVNTVKDLQKQWKEAGSIPEEAFKKLNDEYWKVCQQYFEGLKAFRAAEKKSKPKDEKEILAVREGILKKMRDVAEHCLINVQGELNVLKGEWKDAGSLPKAKFSTLQKEFSSLANLINEQLFVLQMATRKNKDFAQKKDHEKLQLSMQVLKNLLRRDKDELASFSENMGNMHINKGSFVDMLESKLKAQQRKVEQKQALLKTYQKKYDRIKPS